MTLLVKTLSGDRLEWAVEESAQKTVRIRGLASTFGDPPDTDNDVIVSGAFTESLLWWKQHGWMPPMYWRHLSTSVIGKWTEISETPRGLEVVGELTPGHSVADDVAASIAHGAVRGLSIGLHVARSQMRSDGVRLIEKLHLHEISVCAVPANLAARIGNVEVKTIREFEELLRAIGFSRRDATAIATGGFPRARRDVAPSGKTDLAHRDDADAWRRINERLTRIAELAEKVVR